MEPEKDNRTTIDEGLKDFKIYYPARNNPECIEIRYQDIECLAPKAYLSSTIMNFYMRYLQDTLATRGRSTMNYFFNTYFYDKLENTILSNELQRSFSKLRRWWRGVNIFDKAYILFPVNKDHHWSLVIICMPKKKDNLGPIILHLDSHEIHRSDLIFNNVKSFLLEELKLLNERADLPGPDRTWKKMSLEIDEKVIEVPQQRNEYDCGLFVLYFMERFLATAPERFERKDLTMFGREWFQPKEASGLRRTIKKQLMEEFRKDGFKDNAEGLTLQEERCNQELELCEDQIVAGSEEDGYMKTRSSSPSAYPEKDNMKPGKKEKKERKKETPLQSLPTKKRATKNLMPKAKDSLLVVDDEGKKFKEWSDYDIKEAINRHKKNLVKLNLPDGGKKLRAQLQLLEVELKRRNPLQLGVESKRENNLGTDEGSSGVVSSKRSTEEAGGIPMEP